MVYNVLKTLMAMNSQLFDELTGSYKAGKQRYTPTNHPHYSSHTHTLQDYTSNCVKKKTFCVVCSE